jgi:hypothetical protein
MIKRVIGVSNHPEIRIRYDTGTLRHSAGGMVQALSSWVAGAKGASRYVAVHLLSIAKTAALALFFRRFKVSLQGDDKMHFSAEILTMAIKIARFQV